MHHIMQLDSKLVDMQSRLDDRDLRISSFAKKEAELQRKYFDLQDEKELEEQNFTKALRLKDQEVSHQLQRISELSAEIESTKVQAELKLSEYQTKLRDLLNGQQESDQIAEANLGSHNDSLHALRQELSEAKEKLEKVQGEHMKATKRSGENLEKLEIRNAELSKELAATKSSAPPHSALVSSAGMEALRSQLLTTKAKQHETEDSLAKCNQERLRFQTELQSCLLDLDDLRKKVTCCMVFLCIIHDNTHFCTATQFFSDLFVLTYCSVVVLTRNRNRTLILDL
jgi:chromosome segregation ATPase